MEREGQIGVFGQRLEAEPARVVDRRFPDRADRARHHRHAIPACVSAPIQIKTAGVFQRLTACNKWAQIANFRVTRYRADARISKWLKQARERIALTLRIGINKNNDAVTHGCETALQSARLSTILLL